MRNTFLDCIIWYQPSLFIFILRCYLQKRVLNSSRGPAVRALRAQTDKREYAMQMRNIVERQVLMFSFCAVFFLMSILLLR